MKYRHIYAALKQFGFSASKAAEIVLDAQRGDGYSRWFVGRAFFSRRPA